MYQKALLPQTDCRPENPLGYVQRIPLCGLFIDSFKHLHSHTVHALFHNPTTCSMSSSPFNFPLSFALSFLDLSSPLFPLLSFPSSLFPLLFSFCRACRTYARDQGRRAGSGRISQGSSRTYKGRNSLGGPRRGVDQFSNWRPRRPRTGRGATPNAVNLSHVYILVNQNFASKFVLK